MPPRISTSYLFRNLNIPKSNQPHVSSSTSNTDISHLDAVLFHKFKVVHWPSFNEEASKILVGSNREREIEDGRYEVFKANLKSWTQDSATPQTEAQLVTAFKQNVFDIANGLKRDLNLESETTWTANPGSVVSAGIGQRGGSPDMALSLRQQLQSEALTAGEAKRKHVKLRDVSASWLTNKLTRKDHGLTQENDLRPFLQTLAYTLRCQKGIGILTNYDETRFFKLHLGRKLIYMSPMVAIDQVLTESGGNRKPHLLQALLFIESLPMPSSTEMGTTVKLGVENDAFRITEDTPKARAKDGKHRAGSSSKMRDTSSKTSGTGGTSSTGTKQRTSAVYSKDGSNEIRICPQPEHDWEVSRVLAECKMIGELGCGLTGPVTEREYEGKRVAVKAGFAFHTMKNNEADTYSHVLNEVEMYRLLEDVQGDAVPRMIVGGHDIMFFPGCMILITEKVGMEMEEKNGKLFVEGHELGRIELKAARDKALEGLDKIHACGVVHNDPRIANLRVEMKRGKVDRVWWIDFGLGWAEGHLTYGAVDFLRHDNDHKRITKAFDEFLKEDLPQD